MGDCSGRTTLWPNAGMRLRDCLLRRGFEQDIEQVYFRRWLRCESQFVFARGKSDAPEFRELSGFSVTLLGSCADRLIAGLDDEFRPFSTAISDPDIERPRLV